MEANQQATRQLYHDPNLRIIFAVTLMAVLGVSSISPAFTKITEELNVSQKAIGLLITVFTFPGVLLTPVLGVLADRFGRKQILVPSLLLFGIAGVACAFTSSFENLLLLRFLQGIGAAALGSLNATLIGDLYTGKERAAAMGYNASVLSIGTATYPAIGGFLAALSWNIPFFLPIFAIPIGFIVLFKLQSPASKNEQNFLLYLSNAFQGIRNIKVYVLFAAGVMTFIILYGGVLTYYPFIIKNMLGGSEVTTGFIMAAMSFATALTSFHLGKLVRRFSEKILIKVAFLFFALALVMVPFVSNLLLLLIPTIIFGIGQGINFPSNQALLTGMAPIEYRAAFMSINGMVLRLGQTLGPLIMGLVFTFGGINGVFFTAAVLGVLMSLTLIWFLK